MRRQAGFTLMETLVAFSVFSLASVALLDLYSRTAEIRLRGQATAELAGRAAQLMAEAELAAGFQPLSDGIDADGTRWRVAYAPVSDRLVKLEVQIAGPSGREARFATLRTRRELGMEAQP